MPSITLVAMVKDEARILSRMLDSALPYADRLVVLDTGSTDGTQNLVRSYSAKLPVHLYEEPFIDFAQSRSRLLHLARQHGGDYLLSLDADHILHVDDPEWTKKLTADSYLVELREYLRYSLPYITRTDKLFRYLSPTHEYLTCDDGFTQEKIEGIWLEHRGDGGNRHDKYERDLELLEKAYAEDPANVRTIFYLAQTYADLGRKDEAIEMYKRRAWYGGWGEEVYWSLFRAAELTGNTDDYLKAWSYRPERNEALHRFVRKMNEAGNYHAAFVASLSRGQNNDLLFIENWVENYGLDFEHAIAAWYVGHRDRAKEIWERILTLDIPDDFRGLVESNLRFCD